MFGTCFHFVFCIFNFEVNGNGIKILVICFYQFLSQELYCISSLMLFDLENLAMDSDQFGGVWPYDAVMAT